MTETSIPPCMGGFCPKRENCARYLQPSDQPPAERLCQPGGASVFKPVRVTAVAARSEPA